MSGFPDNAVDFILTNPPYLVGFRDRSGRTLAGDRTDEWLQPASHEMYIEQGPVIVKKTATAGGA